jgi:hypothetical protein
VNKLEKVSDQNNSGINDRISMAKEKNAAIQKKLIRIFGKFETLMHYENRIDTRDTQKRDMLLDAQTKLLKRIKNPVRGEKGMVV